MRFIRKIRIEQEQKARKQMLKEKRQQGLKPKYEYNSGTHKNDIEWVSVKMPTVKHSSKVFY